MLALLKSLHQRPRSRLVPLPDLRRRVRRRRAPFAQGGLLDALLKAVRERTQLAVQRNDFKLEQAAAAPVHELPRRRRARPPARHGPQPGRAEGRAGRAGAQCVPGAGGVEAAAAPVARRTATRRCAAPGRGAAPARAAARPGAPPAPPRYTAWTFGELPELMEMRRGGQTLVGFPALIDHGDARRDRGLRRARRGRGQAPRRACAGWSRCRSRSR